MYLLLTVYLISVLVNAASLFLTKSQLEGGTRSHAEAIWIGIFCPVVNTIRSFGILTSFR